jgi:osmotically-inducible protein OsmY
MAEKLLYGRVSDALLGAAAIGSVTIEVERTDVTLHGTVPDVAAMDRIEALVKDIDGVGRVSNRLVIPART